MRFAWGGFVVDNDGVYTVECGEQFSAFVSRKDGAACTFQAANTGVTVKADDQRVPSAREASRVWMWPGWRRSKHPLVKTRRWEPR